MNTNSPMAAVWRKSSYSNQSGGACVETLLRAAVVAVRDSKDLAQGQVSLPAAAWLALVANLKC